MGNFLGNLLPRNQQNYQPNIPMNQNDLNNPYSPQIWGMILHFAVPMFCISAFAYEQVNSEYRYSKLLEENCDTVQKLKKQIEELQLQKQIFPDRDPQFLTEIKKQIEKFETEETHKMQEKLELVKHYEKGLETILDVRCSMFKPRSRRHVIEEHLVLQLSDDYSAISNVVRYPQLKEIYENDHLFCAWSKETNGKLRFMYIKQWKMQLEHEKAQNVVKRIKQYIKIKDRGSNEC